MNVNFRSFIFVLLFFCLANIVFGQDNDGQIKRHRITWTKDNYALRYEVLIEKEENNRYSPLLREFTEEPFIYISLPPGNYRLRVIPYDFRDIPGQGTRWNNFKVLAVTNANSESDSQLVMEASPVIPGQEAGGMSIENPDEVKDSTPPESAAGQEEAGEESPPEKHQGFFIGAFAEGAGYTRYSAAFGGGATLGGSFNGMGIGISLMYAQDEEKFIFLELLAHLRFYLSRVKNNTGLFLQADIGAVFFAHEKFESNDNAAFAIGLRAGARIPLGKYVYFEPNIRGGYPYIFGGGLSLGLRFD
ncbi:MAG: hypothetical protein LBB81_02530 [Treponema sp.]|jgi:hypothetical protein|nr:hypothetical protein [Treponema sp.]